MPTNVQSGISRCICICSEIVLRILEMRANFEIACAISRLRRALVQSRDRALALVASELEATS